MFWGGSCYSCYLEPGIVFPTRKPPKSVTLGSLPVSSKLCPPLLCSAKPRKRTNVFLARIEMVTSVYQNCGKLHKCSDRKLRRQTSHFDVSQVGKDTQKDGGLVLVFNEIAPLPFSVFGTIFVSAARLIANRFRRWGGAALPRFCYHVT